MSEKLSIRWTKKGLNGSFRPSKNTKITTLKQKQKRQYDQNDFDDQWDTFESPNAQFGSQINITNESTTRERSRSPDFPMMSENSLKYENFKPKLDSTRKEACVSSKAVEETLIPKPIENENESIHSTKNPYNSRISGVHSKCHTREQFIQKRNQSARNTNSKPHSKANLDITFDNASKQNLEKKVATLSVNQNQVRDSQSEAKRSFDLQTHESHSQTNSRKQFIQTRNTIPNRSVENKDMSNSKLSLDITPEFISRPSSKKATHSVNTRNETPKLQSKNNEYSELHLDLNAFKHAKTISSKKATHSFKTRDGMPNSQSENEYSELHLDSNAVRPVKTISSKKATHSVSTRDGMPKFQSESNEYSELCLDSNAVRPVKTISSKKATHSLSTRDRLPKFQSESNEYSELHLDSNAVKHVKTKSSKKATHTVSTRDGMPKLQSENNEYSELHLDSNAVRPTISSKKATHPVSTPVKIPRLLRNIDVSNVTRRLFQDTPGLLEGFTDRSNPKKRTVPEGDNLEANPLASPANNVKLNIKRRPLKTVNKSEILNKSTKVLKTKKSFVTDTSKTSSKNVNCNETANPDPEILDLRKYQNLKRGSKGSIDIISLLHYGVIPESVKHVYYN